MASGVRQEMPPSGGYNPIDWAKKAPVVRFNGYAKFGILFGASVVGYAWYYWLRKRYRAVQLKDRDALIALEPLIQAERQRMFMRQLRSNREEEAELMKDVPGWEVGKWKGEPVYWNEANRFPHVHITEYYAHNKYYDMYDRLYDKLYRF